MKRILITLILALVSLSATAQWIFYGEKDGGQGFYDPQTIQYISKNKVTVLTYINLSKDYVAYRTTVGQPLELSHRIIQQYDCKNRTFQFIESKSYSENHLLGRLLRYSRDSKENLSLIDDMSPSANLLKILCKK